MPTLHKKIPIRISTGTYIGICVLLLIFPMKWVLYWFTAAATHELAHYIVLKICRVRILATEVGLNGAKIVTEPVSAWKECLAALAGPFSGVLLMFTARWIPQLAVCAFFQTCLNLIPIREFDGGRVINCLLRELLGGRLADRICTVVEFVSLATLLFIGLYSKTGALLPIVIAILIIRRLGAKTPCKPGKQIVQCTQSSIRGTKHE